MADHNYENNYFYKTLQQHRFSQDTDTGAVALTLLKWLIGCDELTPETELRFESMAEQVPDHICDTDFIHGVFFLVRKLPVDSVLRQRFKVWNVDKHGWDEVTVHDVLPYLQQDTTSYSHPITKVPLTREQFEEQVVTFFSPTIEFLESKNSPIC